jgi:hypothetical protein
MANTLAITKVKTNPKEKFPLKPPPLDRFICWWCQ